MRTLIELKEYLKKEVDEITLLEMFNISSEDIVEMFSDRVEDKYESLLEEFELNG